MIQAKNLQEFDFEEMKELVLSLGLPVFRARQIYEMVQSNKEWEEATNLPKNIKEKFLDYFTLALSIIKQQSGRDGVVKYLFKANDNNVIEGVFLPNKYGNTLCISSQVGCAMGCTFCASGINGLIRNLTPGEMLAQVLAVNRINGGTLQKRAISNVVIMGSGEPLDNYDNLIKFFALLSSEEGLNLSLRNVTVSTSGLADKIRKLADEKLPLTLTISLHSADDEKRKELMPVAKLFSVDEIISAADYYFEKTGRRVSYEYALTKNNSDMHSMYVLASKLKGKNVHVNLIRLNQVKEQDVIAADENKAEEALEFLVNYGIQATIRRSLGSDIEGACGQLRNHYLKSKNEIL